MLGDRCVCVALTLPRPQRRRHGCSLTALSSSMAYTLTRIVSLARRLSDVRRRPTLCPICGPARARRSRRLARVEAPSHTQSSVLCSDSAPALAPLPPCSLAAVCSSLALPCQLLCARTLSPTPHVHVPSSIARRLSPSLALSLLSLPLRVSPRPATPLASSAAITILSLIIPFS